MAFLLLFFDVSVSYRGAGQQGRMGQGGVGGGKSSCLGHPMSSYDAHTVANAMLVGHRVSGSKPRFRPPIVPSIGPIVPVMTLEGRQNALQKSRPVNI